MWACNKIDAGKYCHYSGVGCGNLIFDNDCTKCY